MNKKRVIYASLGCALLASCTGTTSLENNNQNMISNMNITVAIIENTNMNLLNDNNNVASLSTENANTNFVTSSKIPLGFAKYENSKFGYSFQYPKDRIVFLTNTMTETLVPATPSSPQVALAPDAKNEALSIDSDPNLFTVTVVETTNTLKEWFKTNWTDSLIPGEGNEIKKIEISNLPAISLLGGGSVTSPYKVIVVKKGNYIYELKIRIKNDILDKALNSFELQE